MNDRKPSSAPTAEITRLSDWKIKVLTRDGYSCLNCESKLRVAACFIIPLEAGGNLRVSNGVSVCRDCRIKTESGRTLSQRIDNKTPINFLMGSRLHRSVKEYASNGSKFGSVSALLRSMVTAFITQPELYEDLQNWQDNGSEVKVNGWVDGAQYEIFKGMCRERGLSYTDALKALLLVAIDGYQPDDNRH